MKINNKCCHKQILRYFNAEFVEYFTTSFANFNVQNIPFQ